MKFEYTTNIRDVIKELNMAAADARPAVVRALNKTIAQVKVHAAREVSAAGYKLKIRDIKDAIKINRASSGRLRADAVARGRPISLMKYNAKDIKPNGVSVNVLRGRKVIAHAFIANTKNGPQVFLREPGGKHKKVVKGGKVQWSGLPIRKLFGPSIPDALGNKAVAQAMVDLITKRFPINLEHEHAWLATRLPRPTPLPAD